MTAKYDKDAADVVVTFNDGEVRAYRISAGPSIGGYLAREANQKGILTLWNKEQSFGIPVANIRDWAINPVPVQAETASTEQ